MAAPGTLNDLQNIYRGGDVLIEEIHVKPINSRCDFQRTVQPEVDAGTGNGNAERPAPFPRPLEHEWAIGPSLARGRRGLIVTVTPYWPTYPARGGTSLAGLVDWQMATTTAGKAG